MSLTTAEVKKFLQSCFPLGSEMLYDWDNSAANIGQFFTGIAGAWKTYGTDILDTLRLEINPGTCTQNIPVWESALGLRDTPIAKFGTTIQRRNAILAWLRQSTTFSVADCQSIIQPYFLYSDPTAIQIMETNRTNLDTLLNFVGTAFGAIALSASTFRTVDILDDPRVDTGGVRLHFRLSGTLDQIGIFLIGPDGTQAAWETGYLGSGVTALTHYYLRAPQFIGKAIKGTWTFGIWNGPAAAAITTWDLMVEGVGANYDINGAYTGEGLGAAMFELAVVADTALLGTGYDLVGALRALQRWKPAHVRATIVQKIGADVCATPDTITAMPDAAIACS